MGEKVSIVLAQVGILFTACRVPVTTRTRFPSLIDIRSVQVAEVQVASQKVAIAGGVRRSTRMDSVTKS